MLTRHERWEVRQPARHDGTELGRTRCRCRCVLVRAGPFYRAWWYWQRGHIHLTRWLSRHGDNEAVAPAVHRPDVPLPPSAVANGFAGFRYTVGQRRVRDKLLGPELREQLLLGDNLVRM